MEQSPNDYLNQFRFAEAKEALLTINVHITIIAFNAFASPQASAESLIKKPYGNCIFSLIKSRA
jgi:transcriptional regulator GlxA family with amidase domain